MALATYLYSEGGLRWREGTLCVPDLSGSTPAGTMLPVRRGHGEGKGRHVPLADVTTSVTATVETRYGIFTVPFSARTALGRRGRRTSLEQLRQAFVDAAHGTMWSPVDVARAQMETMPYLNRSDDPYAGMRLRVAAEFLSPGEFEETARWHDDALRAATPELVEDLYERDRSVVVRLARDGRHREAWFEFSELVLLSSKVRLEDKTAVFAGEPAAMRPGVA